MRRRLRASRRASQGIPQWPRSTERSRREEGSSRCLPELLSEISFSRYKDNNFVAGLITPRRRLLRKPSQVCVFGVTCDANRPQKQNTVAGQTFFADLRHFAPSPATPRPPAPPRGQLSSRAIGHKPWREANTTQKNQWAFILCLLFQVFIPVKQHIIHKKRKNLHRRLAAGH